MTKQDQQNAEKAIEWYLYEICGCPIHQIRRAIRTKYQKVDFFGCDAMGMDHNGTKIFIQVTTGEYEAVRQRKRKLEKFTWHKYDNINVFQMIKKKSGRTFDYYFIIWDYEVSAGEWFEEQSIAIPKKWFKKLRID